MGQEVYPSIEKEIRDLDIGVLGEDLYMPSPAVGRGCGVDVSFSACSEQCRSQSDHPKLFHEGVRTGERATTRVCVLLRSACSVAYVSGVTVVAKQQVVA